MPAQEYLSGFDKSLLERVSKGDERAFEELVIKISGILHTYIFRHIESKELSEEIVQDILTQVWLTREYLAEVRNFHTYLYVLCRNRAVNELKKAIRNREKHHQWVSNYQNNPEDSEAMDRENRLTVIEQAIEQLAPQQKTAWTLSRQKGLTYNEVASEMNISRETVKKYLQHAHASIMKFLSRHPDIFIIIYYFIS